MRANTYQILLIASGLLVTALVSVFFYREFFPEYRLYQNAYLALEEFRSTYTHESLPPFKTGIKQIVREREDKGPAVIDRCTSCHVALQIPYFSPTHEDYIWKKLDEKIAELRDEKILAQLESEGQAKEVKRRLAEAEKYASLKVAQVGHQTYDVTKVLAMHPLMGNETRPFEFHPLEEYGCTSCHNGNGRGLVTDKAHGPVFDGQYEVEFRGPVPRFLDKDPVNDPPFARVFNDKPGHTLLFQTEPLFVGALMQAKCMQCHQTSDQVLESINSQLNQDQIAFTQDSLNLRSSKVDELTRNYQRGKALYLSQGCFACHRIAGFTRGGVGPELTRIGDNYPWYIKESIVWPQADLKSSTMPNMRLDHQELEDILTFLLAQKGGNRAVSQTAYQAALQAWEAGRKLPWEKPIPPAEMYDLRYAMTIFATQGCASCHRLQGFESNVGFKVEKESTSFEQVYEQQQWFKRLFPEVVRLTNYDEELPGEELTNRIEQHAKEIDERIIANVRQDGILEEINRSHPEAIEALYSNFRYAARAKNHHPDEAVKQAWQERVHRVLMMYIQVYGLGRLIGPHLNWSGVMRTDEWLMEHFRNPSSRVPRSLMPVIPFDDTKFYALTYMLDQLAVRNREAVRQIWSHRGFDPQEAYAIHCAQCHGIGRQGYGVISEWIYPIPKNLNNPDFLRNLSKERVMDSIMHGVKGTPMPPWSEIGQDKPERIQKEIAQAPILTEAEVRYLVDWLFSSLPGGEVIRESSDIPKWRYQPHDILQELEKEGGYATIPAQDIFDQVDYPTGPDPVSYYIKKKYYTPYNIQEGQKYFLLNCAVCHGNEGDGSGSRGQAMQESKPRMLTNLDWIHSRDDLRLLRSIKYGVPGTSMTPWGDFTNSLQRLQLVMFIRNLVESKEEVKQ